MEISCRYFKTVMIRQQRKLLIGRAILWTILGLCTVRHFRVIQLLLHPGMLYFPAAVVLYVSGYFMSLVLTFVVTSLNQIKYYQDKTTVYQSPTTSTTTVCVTTKDQKDSTQSSTSTTSTPISKQFISLYAQIESDKTEAVTNALRNRASSVGTFLEPFEIDDTLFTSHVNSSCLPLFHQAATSVLNEALKTRFVGRTPSTCLNETFSASRDSISSLSTRHHNNNLSWSAYVPPQRTISDCSTTENSPMSDKSKNVDFTLTYEDGSSSTTTTSADSPLIESESFDGIFYHESSSTITTPPVLPSEIMGGGGGTTYQHSHISFSNAQERRKSCQPDLTIWGHNYRCRLENTREVHHTDRNCPEIVYQFTRKRTMSVSLDNRNPMVITPVVQHVEIAVTQNVTSPCTNLFDCNTVVLLPHAVPILAHLSNLTLCSFVTAFYPLFGIASVPIGLLALCGVVNLAELGKLYHFHVYTRYALALTIFCIFGLCDFRSFNVSTASELSNSSIAKILCVVSYAAVLFYAAITIIVSLSTATLHLDLLSDKLMKHSLRYKTFMF